MKTLSFAAMACLVVAGCSDPSTSRLSPGQEAMIKTPDGKPLFDTLEFPVRHNDRDHVWVNNGTKVRVASDEDTKFGDTDWRPVNVIVIEGDAAGIAIKPSRGKLRPLR